jgi:hypothetical protein
MKFKSKSTHFKVSYLPKSNCYKKAGGRGQEAGGKKDYFVIPDFFNWIVISAKLIFSVGWAFLGQTLNQSEKW